MMEKFKIRPFLYCIGVTYFTVFVENWYDACVAHYQRGRFHETNARELRETLRVVQGSASSQFGLSTS